MVFVTRVSTSWVECKLRNVRLSHISGFRKQFVLTVKCLGPQVTSLYRSYSAVCLKQELT